MKIPCRRGTMMVVAIVLLGLIGVALAGLTQQFASDLHRLQDQADAAQARQILIATTRSLQGNPDQKFMLPLALRQAGADAKITPIARQPNRAVIRIDVISGKSRAAEILTLDRAAGHWTIADVDLR